MGFFRNFREFGALIFISVCSCVKFSDFGVFWKFVDLELDGWVFWAGNPVFGLI